MIVNVKLFATLRAGRGKIVELSWVEGLTPRQIIQTLDISEEDVAILLINGRDGTLDRILKQGDFISIFPPVGGG
jgi:sulfur-carrier protein